MSLQKIFLIFIWAVPVHDIYLTACLARLSQTYYSPLIFPAQSSAVHWYFLSKSFHQSLVKSDIVPYHTINPLSLPRKSNNEWKHLSTFKFKKNPLQWANPQWTISSVELGSTHISDGCPFPYLPRASHYFYDISSVCFMTSYSLFSYSILLQTKNVTLSHCLFKLLRHFISNGKRHVVHLFSRTLE